MDSHRAILGLLIFEELSELGQVQGLYTKAFSLLGMTTTVFVFEVQFSLVQQFTVLGRYSVPVYRQLSASLATLRNFFII